MNANGKALILNGGEGLVKIIADRKYREVPGLHIIGPRATDLISEGALALRLEATLDELITTIHSHPTVTETVREAALHAEGPGQSIPKIKTNFFRIAKRPGRQKLPGLFGLGWKAVRIREEAAVIKYEKIS